MLRLDSLRLCVAARRAVERTRTVRERLAHELASTSEDGSVEAALDSIKVSDHLGGDVGDDASLVRLCQRGFQLTVADAVFNVAPPSYFGGAYGLVSARCGRA